jgi:hypothetical protein
VGSRKIKRPDPPGKPSTLSFRPSPCRTKISFCLKSPHHFEGLTGHCPTNSPRGGRFAMIFSKCHLYALCDIMR